MPIESLAEETALAVLAGDRQRVLALTVAVPCAQRLRALGFSTHARTILERLAGPDLRGCHRGPTTLCQALQDASDDQVVPGRVRRLCRLAEERLNHDLTERWEHGPCRACVPRRRALRQHRWQEALERSW